jgi:polar amino acid transport system substrate-binding protein
MPSIATVLQVVRLRHEPEFPGVVMRRTAMGRRSSYDGLLKVGSLCAAMVCSLEVAVAATPPVPPAMAASKTITYCAAMTLPPVIFINSDLKPDGVDVAFGNMLAHRLGLTAKWNNVAFSGIIPALVSGHCDAIVSALYIQAARLKVIDELPYMYVSQSVLLKAGAPKLNSLAQLSGRKVAAVTGSATNMLLDEANEALTKAGKPAINVIDFPDNSAALQQLQFGQVKAFTVQYETAVYYSQLVPSQFELGIAPFYKVPIGIGLRKNDPVLEAAVKSTLDGMEKDGSLTGLLQKWGLTSDALPQ